MGFFRGLLNRLTSPGTEQSYVTRFFLGPLTPTATFVDHDRALRNATVWACVQYRTKAVAQLPRADPDVLAYWRSNAGELLPDPSAVQHFPRSEVAFGRETLAASAGPGSVEAGRQPTHRGKVGSATASTIIPFKAGFCNVVIFNHGPHPAPDLRKPLA